MGPRLLETVANNTVAVLTQAKDQQSAWRTDLGNLRNQATANHIPQMVALVDATTALLDAEGDAKGIAVELSGMFQATWQAIIDTLAKIRTDAANEDDPCATLPDDLVEKVVSACISTDFSVKGQTVAYVQSLMESHPETKPLLDAINVAVFSAAKLDEALSLDGRCVEIWLQIVKALKAA